MAFDAIEALRTFIKNMSQYNNPTKSEHELKFDYTIQNNPEYKGTKYADDIVFGPGFKIIDDQSKKHSGGSATTTTATTATPTITYNKSQKKNRYNKKRYNKQRTIKMRR